MKQLGILVVRKGIVSYFVDYHEDYGVLQNPNQEDCKTFIGVHEAEQVIDMLEHKHPEFNYYIILLR